MAIDSLYYCLEDCKDDFVPLGMDIELFKDADCYCMEMPEIPLILPLFETPETPDIYEKFIFHKS